MITTVAGNPTGMVQHHEVKKGPSQNFLTFLSDLLMGTNPILQHQNRRHKPQKQTFCVAYGWKRDQLLAGAWVDLLSICLA
jgi:hypothetical protein